MELYRYYMYFSPVKTNFGLGVVFGECFFFCTIYRYGPRDCYKFKRDKVSSVVYIRPLYRYICIYYFGYKTFAIQSVTKRPLQPLQPRFNVFSSVLRTPTSIIIYPVEIIVKYIYIHLQYIDTLNFGMTVFLINIILWILDTVKYCSHLFGHNGIFSVMILLLINNLYIGID